MQNREPTLIRHFIRSAQLRADLIINGYSIISEATLPDGSNITTMRHSRTGRRLRLTVSNKETTLTDGTKILKRLTAQPLYETECTRSM